MAKKASEPKKPLSVEWFQEIWPQERDVMSRPDRYRYVRRLIVPEGCVFCKARETGVGFESLNLYMGETAMLVLNKYPYNNGHLLVLPQRHVGSLLDLSEKESLELYALLRKAQAALLKVYNCSGFNIGINQGAVSGAGIPDHLHWHIVPRWAGDTNFFPILAETKVQAESLEQTYERLLPYFRGIDDDQR